MAKIAKNSELAETSSKVVLCEDPREARIEISSWKYDDHFLRLATIYFSDVYKNTNNLDLDGSKIRQMFLKNFDFRKSLIEFWQKKWLWLDNLHVRNMMTHQMNFEWEDIDKIKKDYANQVKEMFFKDKKSDESEVPEAKDPILLLLQEDDKQKVILSKRYWGDMKTFTRLCAILQFADAKEQKDVLQLLVSNDSRSGIASNCSREMIDALWDDAITEILSRGSNRYEIIIHVIDKKMTQNVSAKRMSSFLERERRVLDGSQLSEKLVALIMHFLQWLDLTSAPIKEDVLIALEKCFLAIQNNYHSHDIVDFSKTKINFGVVEKALAKKIAENWTLKAGVELCKKSIKKKGSSKKVKA